MMGRTEILALVPHSGRMCLLERVLRWDATEIECEAVNHTDPDHPLRRHGRLAALHLLEYGAQAMAVHGSLLAGSSAHARGGMLVSARDLRLEIAYIDDLPGSLQIIARKLIASPAALSYEFEVHHGMRRLASGRVSVITAAG